MFKTPPANAAVPPTEVSRDVRNRLVRLAYRFLWNHEDAEDAVQEALTTSFERRSELRDKSKWWAWTSRILVSRCHSLSRRKRTRRHHEDSLAEQTPERPGELGLLQGDDDRKVVGELLMRLPERQKEVMVLRHLEQMNYDQIGELLEMSPSTARVHARAGLEALRDLIKERHPGFLEGE